MKICTNCKNPIALRLQPEFSSSGIWCDYCGIEYGNPKELFPDLSDELIASIEGWNWLWEFCYKNQKINQENAYNIITKMGDLLLDQIRKYYNCKLIIYFESKRYSK